MGYAMEKPMLETMEACTQCNSRTPRAQLASRAHTLETLAEDAGSGPAPCTARVARNRHGGSVSAAGDHAWSALAAASCIECGAVLAPACCMVGRDLHPQELPRARHACAVVQEADFFNPIADAPRVLWHPTARCSDEAGGSPSRRNGKRQPSEFSIMCSSLGMLGASAADPRVRAERCRQA